MRVLLVFPSRRDPAHRRVAEALRRELSLLGDHVRVLAPKRRELEAALAAWRPEVCHIQFFSRGLGDLAGLKIPAETRLVLTHQGASPRLIESPAAFQALAARADAVTAVSRAGLAELGRKAFVVPNGTDSVRTGGGGAFILSVARLAAYKGTDLLLMAYAQLAPAVTLVLCGPDQSGGRLRALAARLGIARRVKFLGERDFAAVSQLLRRCLLFVLPSRSENHPMALLEAMAAGKAVVAADVGGVREIVRSGRDGLLIPARDVRALREAMERLLASPALRRRLGESARLRSKAFSWKAAALGYRRIYAALAPRRPKSPPRTLPRSITGPERT